MTAAAVQAKIVVAQHAVTAVKVSQKKLNRTSKIFFHILDDQGDSDYYQRKETGQEMEEKGRGCRQ